MYDKIKLWLPQTPATPDLSTRLSQARIITDTDTGAATLKGNIEGLSVWQGVGGVSILGSLPKWLYGNNASTLTRHDTAQAIEKISDTLHLDVSDADVRHLEFASTFIMKKPVDVYLRQLGDMPYYGREQFKPTSLYYKTNGKKHTKVFHFYDKGAQADDSGQALPDCYSGANLLRYEMRIWKIAQTARCPNVKASTLSELNLFEKLLNMWQKHFFSIIKHPQPQMENINGIKTVSDAYDALVARLIAQGGISNVDAFIEQLKEAQVFPDRKYYTRLKNRVNKAVTQSPISTTDEDIRELEDEVRQAGAYI